MGHTVILVMINPWTLEAPDRSYDKRHIKVTNANVIVIITIWHQLVMSREECVFPNRNNANLLYFITKVHLIIILDIFLILEKMYFEVLLTLNSDWSNYVSVCNKAQEFTNHKVKRRIGRTDFSSVDP